LGTKSTSEQIAFASFSAAQWLAPYGRTGTHDAVDRLKRELKLAPAQNGENVVVMVPKDNGLFRDVVEPASGAVCTSPVQTYLDLAAADPVCPERSRGNRSRGASSWPPIAPRGHSTAP
jgi:hypothetical protein